MSVYTEKEKRLIRAYYNDTYVALRFREDGSVEAKWKPWSAWGRLYSADEARRHLEAVKGRD